MAWDFDRFRGLVREDVLRTFLPDSPDARGSDVPDVRMGIRDGHGASPGGVSRPDGKE